MKDWGKGEARGSDQLGIGCFQIVVVCFAVASEAISYSRADEQISGKIPNFDWRKQARGYVYLQHLCMLNAV